MSHQNPLRHVKAAPPDKNWTGQYTPKRARRLERRNLEAHARMMEAESERWRKRAEFAGEDTVRQRLEQKAKELLASAAAFANRAKALFGHGIRRARRRRTVGARWRR